MNILRYGPTHLVIKQGEVWLGVDSGGQLGDQVVVVGVEEFGHVQCLGAGNAARHGKVLVIARQLLQKPHISYQSLEGCTGHVQPAWNCTTCPPICRSSAGETGAVKGRNADAADKIRS